MHTRPVTFVSRLTVACVSLLALPAPAMAATLTGPASISENAGMATYTLTCALLDIGLVSVSSGPAPAATEGDDYTQPSGLPASCTAIASEQTIQVPIVNDTIDETDEHFSVTQHPDGADDPDRDRRRRPRREHYPSRTPDRGRFRDADGEHGRDARVRGRAQTTTIAFETADLSATAGSDYTETSGNVVFQPGDMTKTISVPVMGDTTPEVTEAFVVNLLNSDNGSLNPTKKQAAIGIFDNDKAPLPTVSLPKRVFVAEGSRGSGNILFDVKLSSAAAQRTEVGWKTGNWTADKTDYDSAHGKVVFKQGQKSKTISIDVKGDRRDEPDEAFTVELRNPVAATLGAQKAAFGVIEDDDGPKMRIGKPRLRGERLVAKVGCPDSADGCTGKLVARSEGLRLGRKRFDLEGGEAKRLKLKLSDAAQEALSETRRRAKLKATASDSTGDRRVTTRKARLKRLH